MQISPTYDLDKEDWEITDGLSNDNCGWSVHGETLVLG